jgi:ribonucleotide monophosphatase NagD (HAD superfamily)
MKTLPRHLTPDIWLQQVFTSTEARKGGVVKCKIRDVERLVGRQAFLNEVEKRGFQAVGNHQHYVLSCNTLPLRRARP